MVIFPPKDFRKKNFELVAEFPPLQESNDDR